MTQPSVRGPVTVVMSREVTAGREREFEDQIDQIKGHASRCEGFDGVGLIRPDPQEHRYHATLRFRDATTLDNWLNSRKRADMVERLDGITKEVDRRLTTTGLETWFSLPRQVVESPPRWKMALVTGSAVYLLVPVVQYAVGSRVAAWPVPLGMAVPAVLLTLLLAYLVLPILSRLLGSWLYGEGARGVASSRGAQ